MQSIVRCVLGVALVLWLAPSCRRDVLEGAEAASAQEARQRVEHSLADGDLAGAASAIDELARVLPDTAESDLELGRLLAFAGQPERTLWRLEARADREPARADLRLALAEVALVLSDPQRALAHLDALDPEARNTVEAARLQSEAQLALGDVNAALATLARSEELHPNHDELRAARIELLIQERRLTEALALVEEARRQVTTPGAVRRRLDLRAVDLHAAVGDRTVALAELEALLEEAPDDHALWQRRVDLLIRSGQVEQARALLANALESRPDAAVLWSQLARVERAAGRREAAEAAERRALDHAPSARGAAALAEALHRDGRTREAAVLIGEILDQLGQDSPVDLAAMGVASWLGAGEIELARERFRSLQRTHPRDPRVEYLRARFALAEGRTEDAIQRLLRVAPQLDRSDVQYWLGVALERAGDDAGAEYRYGLATVRDPAEIASQLALMRVLARRGAWEDVESRAAAIIQLAPDSPAGYEWLARALLARGDAARAEGVLRRHVERSPDLPGARLALASLLRHEGDPAEALRVLASGPDDAARGPRWTAERAAALAALGRVEEAHEALDSAERRGERDAALHRSRAYLWLLSDSGDLAALEVERALALDPLDPSPLRMLGDFAVRSGDLEEAAHLYERALEASPRDADLWSRLADARWRRGEGRAARAAWQRVVELEPDSVPAHNNLALALLAQGRLEPALRHAQAALARAPDDPRVMDTAATLYLEAGRTSRAALLLERAAALDPASPAIARRLAMARARGSDPASPSDRRDAATGSPAAQPASPTPEPPAAAREAAARLAALERPNLVLIVVDTLRADWTTPYGFEQDTTPELARWSAEGVVFDHVLAQSSWTKVSMASLFTSLWPRSHGVRLATDGLGASAITVAKLLSEAGYRCYAVQSNGWLEQSFGFQHGFDHYVFPRGFGPIAPGSAIWPHGERVLDEALRLLTAHEDGGGEAPFFLYLHFMDVHEYASPPGFRRFGSGRRGAYLAAIRWVDHLLERLRRTLEHSGTLASSVIVFTSDHGESFGENQSYGHALHVLTPVLRVPLVVRIPGLAEQVRVASQVRLVDLAPTLLEVAGAAPPAHFEGRTLIRLLRGDEAADRISYAALGAPILKGAIEQISLTDGRWTLARQLGIADAHEQLFDRGLDPAEDANLIGLEPEAEARLRAALDAHWSLTPRSGVREADVRIHPQIAERLRALGYLD